MHGIADVIPFVPREEPKSCEYLFIEADEDHVAEQHGRWSRDNPGFISRLAYVYEYKQENPKVGRSKTGADRMSKLRAYERNYGREKLIELVRYSRKQRIEKRTGTDDEIVAKVSLREIRSEHYDQSRSYIDRIQATIPGLTARKTMAIRARLRLM